MEAELLGYKKRYNKLPLIAESVDEKTIVLFNDITTGVCIYSFNNEKYGSYKYNWDVYYDTNIWRIPQYRDINFVNNIKIIDDSNLKIVFPIVAKDIKSQRYVLFLDYNSGIFLINNSDKNIVGKYIKNELISCDNQDVWEIPYEVFLRFKNA